MNHIVPFLPAVLFGFALMTPVPAQRPSANEELLGAALHQEEVEGNPEAAASLYRKFLDSHPRDRA